MTAELLDVAADDELLHPAYWLVLALSWPGGNAAEALLAVAPGMIPREPAEVAPRRPPHPERHGRGRVAARWKTPDRSSVCRLYQLPPADTRGSSLVYFNL